MNINSIQSNEVLPVILRSTEVKSSRVDAGKELSPELSVPALPSSSDSANDTQSPVGQAQKLIRQINYTKEQLDKILNDFPPFFPPGSYQRIDLIKAVRGIQDEVEKSSVQIEMVKEVSSRKLTEDATDSDISAALNKLFDFRDELSKSIPLVTESPQPGTLVNIKI